MPLTIHLIIFRHKASSPCASWAWTIIVISSAVSIDVIIFIMTRIIITRTLIWIVIWIEWLWCCIHGIIINHIRIYRSSILIKHRNLLGLLYFANPTVLCCIEHPTIWWCVGCSVRILIHRHALCLFDSFSFFGLIPDHVDQCCCACNTSTN